MQRRHAGSSQGARAVRDGGEVACLLAADCQRVAETKSASAVPVPFESSTGAVQAQHRCSASVVLMRCQFVPETDAKVDAAVRETFEQGLLELAGQLEQEIGAVKAELQAGMERWGREAAEAPVGTVLGSNLGLRLLAGGGGGSSIVHPGVGQPKCDLGFVQHVAVISLTELGFCSSVGAVGTT